MMPMHTTCRLRERGNRAAGALIRARTDFTACLYKLLVRAGKE